MPIVVPPMKLNEARSQFSQLLNRTHRSEIRVPIYKGSIPVGALVSADDLERLNRLDAQRNELFDAVQEFSAQFNDIPAEEIDREVDRAVTEVRKEIWAERQSRAAA